MRKSLMFFTLLFFSYVSFCQVGGNLTTQQGNLSFTTENGYDRIEVDYAVTEKIFTSQHGNYGEPEIPLIQRKYLLPLDADQVNLQITSTTVQSLASSYNIYPEQPPIFLNGGEAPDWVDPDPSIYQSNDPYPGITAEIFHVESTFGYKVVTVNLYPVSYLPLSQTLELYTDISFQISYTTTAISQPQKISADLHEVTRSSISALVSNESDMDVFLGSATQVVSSSQQESMAINSMPGSDGTIPELIVITSDEFNQEVEGKYDLIDFAKWKTKTGIPTVIVTTEEINQQYSGSDQAERIFYYLKDVYNHWGSMYVILGGDVEIIPARYAVIDIHLDIWRPTDLYYSDVFEAGKPEYNWNRNGNNQYGEPYVSVEDRGDDVRGGADHFVGRFSFSNTDELHNILTANHTYQTADVPDLTYFNNLLVMTGFLNDGLTLHYGNFLNGLINSILTSNSYLNPWRLYDDPALGGQSFLWDETFNRQNTLGNLDHGGSQFGNPFHLVYHMDHSGPLNMST